MDYDTFCDKFAVPKHEPTLTGAKTAMACSSVAEFDYIVMSSISMQTLRKRQAMIKALKEIKLLPDYASLVTQQIFEYAETHSE